MPLQRNPIMAAKRGQEAIDKMVERDEALAKQVAELIETVNGVVAQNTELQRQVRTMQTQLADVSNTVKGLLPALKTQQATPPTSRQGS